MPSHPPQLPKIYKRAIGLMVVHNGACSVQKGSELYQAFVALGDEGFVKIIGESMPAGGVDMVQVYLFNHPAATRL